MNTADLVSLLRGIAGAYEEMGVDKIQRGAMRDAADLIERLQAELATANKEVETLSELTPCAMAPKQAAEKLQESYAYMTRVMPEGKRSQTTINLLAAMSCAISVCRAQPANELLTPEIPGQMCLWEEPPCAT